MVAIGEASRLSGVSVETIRYYEREGFIAKANRATSGWRVYTSIEISELRFIKQCRDLGFSIRDTIALRTLAKKPGATCGPFEEIGRNHLTEVRAKIADLHRLECALVELLANCADDRKDCPMLDALMD